MSSRRFQFGLILSVTLHLLLLVFVAVTEEGLIKPEDEQIEVTFVDPGELPETLKQQIVDQSEKSLNNEIPTDTAFLGKTNQRVVKQTRAEKQGKFTNAVGGGEAKDPTPKKKPQKADKKKVAKKEKGTLPTLSDLKPKFDWDQVGSKGSRGETQGVAQTSDYLKDVDAGVQTLLSTREFVYYSYYSRIKNKLQRFWEPKIKEKMTRLLRSGRKIASTSNDRITQVIITLDSEGILQRVQVIGESGVRDLDEAAIEAFRAAAPFPNPPKGIVEKDGTVKIRWDFVLEA